MMASIQAAFEETLLEAISVSSLEPVEPRIVLTGGCALNIKANELVRRMFGGDNVWVPAAPNDSGLSIGLALHHTELTQSMPWESPSAFLGLGIADIHLLTSLRKQYHAQRVDVADIAATLVSGKVVATLRGRQEMGPRALGHRSFLSRPGGADVKQRMNQIKGRQWWRPVAPAVMIEHVHLAFELEEQEQFSSPFMSFALRVRPSLATSTLLSITHVDGTARVQTVSQTSEPWLHSVLAAVAAHVGLGLLMNTSFNLKNEAIVNTIVRALEILESVDVDCVLIEDFLFEKPAADSRST
jgi:carbamoyltransferase